MSKSNNKMIHEKAIRLLEGGVVEVDGLSVKAVEVDSVVDECYLCEMDSLCHIGSNMAKVCAECDSIGQEHYYLKLVNEDCIW